MIFHVNLGVEEISASGTSYLNRAEVREERLVRLLNRTWSSPPPLLECSLSRAPRGPSFLLRSPPQAANVEKIVTLLLRNGVRPDQIGVVTPYDGQRAHVIMVMERNGKQHRISLAPL